MVLRAYRRGMDGAPTNSRKHVIIDDRDFVLDPRQDVSDIMSRIEDAARSGPAFVDIGEHGTHVLISSSTRVVIAEDEQDTVPLQTWPEDFQDWEL